MGEVQNIFTFNLMGHEIPITFSVVSQWVAMLVIMGSVFIMTRKLEKVPRSKSQIWLEVIVEKINNLVRDNMGEKYLNYAPFIGTLMIYLLVLNLFGLTGFRPPTSDYSVALALAIISFVVIQAHAIKKLGVGHYLGGFGKPFWFMTPLNIIERAIVPVSLSLRLFGNITAAVIIVELLYKALGYFSNALHLKIPVLQILLPIPFHIYFDLFDGAIQMFIFVMLTMIFIKTTSEH